MPSCGKLLEKLCKSGCHHAALVGLIQIASYLGAVAEVKRGAASQHLKYMDHGENCIRLLRINDAVSDRVLKGRVGSGVLSNVDDYLRFGKKVRKGFMLVVSKHVRRFAWRQAEILISAKFRKIESM
jgi:hypothetical protein